jgi:hypothetical protein
MNRMQHTYKSIVRQESCSCDRQHSSINTLLNQTRSLFAGYDAHSVHTVNNVATLQTNGTEMHAFEFMCVLTG